MDETKIFRYWGGPDAPDRYADPLAILRKLRTLLDGNTEKFIREKYHNLDPMTALDAAERLHAAIAFAFEVKPFDPATGQGMTEDKLIGLFNDFSEWLKKKETTPATSPTAAPPTASGPGPNHPPTRNTSVSPSISPVRGHVKRGSW